MICAGELAPYWRITPKVLLEASLERQNQDFRGNAQILADPLVMQFLQREDRYTFANLGAVWTPTRNWQIGLAVQYTTRSSNVAFEDFNDVSTFATVRFGF